MTESFFYTKFPNHIHKIIATLIVMIFVGLNIHLFSDQTQFRNIRLISDRGNFNIKAELATTFRQLRKGLMYREKLDVGEGMLFVFKKPQIPSFWMKNTLIPLDMMFIGEDLIIKYIEQKAPPCLDSEDCKLYTPPVPVKYVLEVPGGYSKLFGIKSGNSMEFADEDKS